MLTCEDGGALTGCRQHRMGVATQHRATPLGARANLISCVNRRVTREDERRLSVLGEWGQAATWFGCTRKRHAKVLTSTPDARVFAVRPNEQRWHDEWHARLPEGYPLQLSVSGIAMRPRKASASHGRCDAMVSCEAAENSLARKKQRDPLS